MLRIRLKRIGRKKLAHYRIVVMESSSRRDGRPVDDLGFYNPHTNQIELKKSNTLYWIKKGVRPSQRVISLLKGTLV